MRQEVCFEGDLKCEARTIPPQKPTPVSCLLDTLLESLPVMHTTDAIMRRFAELKSSLDGKGKRVDDADVLIAATALTYGCPLVTANVRHFSRFDGLDLLDWSV